MMTKSKYQLILLMLCVSPMVLAEMTSAVRQVQQQWAKVSLMTDKKSQKQAFEDLSKWATQVSLVEENLPEALVWEGVVYTSYAQSMRGLKAISLAKHAKQSFDEAICIDADVLDGTVYSRLGELYSKAAKWPIGIGSDKKANKYLKRGLEYNPDGIENNLLYAEFIIDEEKNYFIAKHHLIKARQALPIDDHTLVEQVSLNSINLLMAEVEEKLTD